jgi:hypothetical protein
VRPTVLAVLLAAAAVAPAEDAPVAVPGLGPATAEVLVADPRWVRDQLAMVAGAAGSDPAPVTVLAARTLLRLGGLDNIDLGRPAALWLRDGATDLALLLPVQRRSKVVDELGLAADGRSPLVRTGDRDGTVVLTQSTADGLVEYRALAVEGWLALARTADESCRLAGRAAALAPEGAPLRITLDPSRLAGAWSRLGLPVEQRWIPERMRLPALPLPGETLPGPGSEAWSALLAQIATIRIEVAPWGGPGDPEAQGRWRVAITVRPLADSPLAAWLSVQRPAADRLGPALDTPSTWFLAAFYPVWQGQAERIVSGPLAAASATAGFAWDARAGEGATALAAGADRSGGIALAEDAGGGLLLVEHGSAPSLAVALGDVLTPLLGAPRTTAVAGVTGVLHSGTTARLTFGTDGALIHAWAMDPAALTPAGERAATAALASPPPGQGGVLGRVRVRIDRLLRPVVAAQRGATVEMPEAEIVADVTVRDGDLVVDADIPATAIAGAIGALELGPRPRPSGDRTPGKR